MAFSNDYESFVKEQYERLDKYQIIEKDDEEFLKHFEQWEFFNYDESLVKLDGVNEKDVRLNTPGKIFLYEKLLTDKNKRIYYPKIGIYLNGLPCDQTIDVEWVDWRRSWEYRRKYEYVNDKGKTKDLDFCYLSTQVQSLPIWHDYLLIYGVWDKLPNWKELRKYYERTWWFHKTIQDKRDIMLNQLIHG
jgi:hypothetical protein